MHGWREQVETGLRLPFRAKPRYRDAPLTWMVYLNVRWNQVRIMDTEVTRRIEPLDSSKLTVSPQTSCRLQWPRYLFLITTAL